MKKLKVVIIVIIVLYIIVTFLLYVFQEKLIFQDSQLSEDFNYQFRQPHVELNIEMIDGGNINALHFKVDESKGLIVYFHGNAGSLDRWGDIAIEITAMGYDVAIMDYRGYGKSTGIRTEKSLKQDALTFYQYFIEEYQEENMILYGRSLGTGFAAYVGSQQKPSKIILETPYYSFSSLVSQKMPLFPAGMLLKYKMPTAEYLKGQTCPIYIFHGTADRVVPYSQGLRLHEGLPDAANSTFYTYEGGGHNNLSTFPSFWKDLQKSLSTAID